MMVILSGLRTTKGKWATLHNPSISRYVLDISISEVTTAKRNFTSTSTAKGRAPESLLRLKSLVTENDHSLARTWLEGFGPEDIPKEAWSASYSRSSGPGGQHVNKTKSKATVRCDLAQSGSWLPPFILGPLSKSAYYVTNPPSLLLSSQMTRTASSNLASALGTLHSTIKNAGQSVIIGQTSDEQKSKVKNLARAEKARLRVDKERRSSKKSARKDFG